MSIVAPWLPEATVVDFFAGSGALGLEALSRGASHADFVERAAASLRILRQNIDALGAGTRARIHRADAVRFAQSLDADAYDVAFADPPYGQGLAATIAEAWQDRGFATILSVEHAVADPMPAGGDSRRYGSTMITFYRRGAAETDS